MFQKSKAFPFHSKVLPQHKRQDITGEKMLNFLPPSTNVLQSRADTQKNWCKN